MKLYVLIFILIAVFILSLLLFHSIKICEGGKIMQGCGKLLFPWTPKIKFTDGTYCCMSCFQRDIDLLSSEGKKVQEETMNILKFTEEEELHGIKFGSEHRAVDEAE